MTPGPPLAIGVDIGGTKIAAGVVGGDGEILERRRVPSPMGMGATLGAVEGLVAELRAAHGGVVALGVGAAGLVEWPEGVVRFALNNGYEDVPMRRHLAAVTGLATIVDNDANAAAWGEVSFGAGERHDHVVMLTLGTGIGGGLVLGGQLYRGASGLGAEVGHLIVDPHGPRCGCGNQGCFEAMASGTALGRLARGAIAGAPGCRLAELAPPEGPIPGEVVCQAAREGDALARALLGEVGHWLGVGIASLVNLFEPQTVVIGGGLADAYDLMAPSLHGSLSRYVYARDHRTLPHIVPARLADAGLVGAAALALACSP